MVDQHLYKLRDVTDGYKLGAYRRDVDQGRFTWTKLGLTIRMSVSRKHH